MMTIILCAASFVLGMLAGQGKLNWVRGATGKARDAVLGSRPAAASLSKAASNGSNPASVTLNAASSPSEVSPTPPKKPIEPLRVLSEIAKFIWHWRHWIVAGLILFFAWRVLAPVVSFVACPFGPGILWCADEDRNAASADLQASEHETDVANQATDLAERTHTNIDHAERAAERGQQDIEDAIRNLPPDVSDADFAALDRVYRDAYLGVYSIPSDNADPHAGRPQPVRRSGANAA